MSSLGHHIVGSAGVRRNCMTDDLMDGIISRQGVRSKADATNASERIPFSSHGWLTLSTTARSGEQSVVCAPRPHDSARVPGTAP